MNTVSGLFKSYSSAELALDVLGIYGVDNDQISVVARGNKSVSQTVAVEQFVEMGFTTEEAEFYTEGVKRGDFLISIEIGLQDEHFIHGILRSAGAVDMNTHNKVRQYGNTYVLNPNAHK